MLEKDVEELLYRAGVMEVDPSVMDHVVGWSAPEHRGISLREFIAARSDAAPVATVATAFGINPHKMGRRVARVADLPQADLTEVVCARLSQSGTGRQLGVLQGGTYSIPDVIVQVRKGSPLGQRIIEAEKRSLELIEEAVLRGILRPAKPKGRPGIEYSVKF